MDLSFLNKIPFLKNVDFSDDMVKKKTLLVFVGALIMLGLIVYSLLPSGDSTRTAQATSTDVVAPSLEIQNGTDNDQISSKTNQSIHKSGNGQSLAEQLFAPKDTVFSDNPLGQIGVGKPGKEAKTTEEQEDSDTPSHIRPGQEGVYPSGSITKDDLLKNMRGSDEDEAARARERELQRRENELRDRQRLIEMGVNPETGLPYNLNQGTSSPAPQQQAQPPVEPEPQPQAVEPEIVTSDEALMDDDDSFGLGTTRINSMSSAKKKDLDKLTIKAMFIEERKVKSGDRIQLRLCEEKGITVEGVHIPKNSLLYANVQLGDRLLIHVQSVNVNGRILPLNLDAYDVDGLKGIYCPSSELDKVSKEVGREARELATGVISGAMRSFGARFVSTGGSAADRLTNESSVYITPGYSFDLMRAQ